MKIQPLPTVNKWNNAQLKEIVLLHADVNYTNILFVNGRKITVPTTMKKLEKRFELSNMFFRTHKSFMVNLQYIKQINTVHDEDYIQMQNDYRVLVSRRRKVAFEQRIKELYN